MTRPPRQAPPLSESAKVADELQQLLDRKCREAVLYPSEIATITFAIKRLRDKTPPRRDRVLTQAPESLPRVYSNEAWTIAGRFTDALGPDVYDLVQLIDDALIQAKAHLTEGRKA